jgi:magnesium-transporting ATPase (P-type)
MSTLKPEDDLDEIVLNNAIFGRVTPDQKADIIACLKRHERIVAVTGDGLNDLLAFKQADCSIALANGAAATKNVANLILLDSNFANMKEAVFQGRRVVNNIQRSSSLFVMKDFLWLFITILPILLGIPHMAQPTVMTMVNVFITGIAALFVSLEPDKTRVKGNFYRNVVEKAIVNGFYMFIPVFLITLYVIISQLVRTGTYNVDGMKTVFENGEIVGFGWLPVMALCITIAGFVIFFIVKYHRDVFCTINQNVSFTYNCHKNAVMPDFERNTIRSINYRHPETSLAYASARLRVLQGTRCMGRLFL